MEGSAKSMRVSRRYFINFLAGLGLGAVATELYEKLYNIPSLEKRFRAEISYWMNQYNSAEEELKRCQKNISSLNEEISSLERREKSLTETLKYQDDLEKESTSSIALYKQQMEEAINGLRRTIEKYKGILGDERVEFESQALKVLEDLHIAKDKLNKVLAYFPLIKSLSWKPTRIVNDKIYDINISFEVISPLNSLREVEVKLIPVEYEYFITDYGMRKEDYSLVFQPEETKSIKLQPKGLEREIFQSIFKDLKGGREYVIVAEAKDVSGQAKVEKLITPYIREFENIAPLDNILVGAYYYPWYSRSRHWKEGYKGRPLLGEYDSRDPIVISKHIDWATGHGIDFFLMSWWGPNSWEDVTIKDFFLKNQLAGHIKIGIIYESVGMLEVIKGEIDLNNPTNIQILLSDFRYLANTYFDNLHYLQIDRAPVVELYLARIFKGNVLEVINNLREQIHNMGYNLYLIGDLVYWQDPRAQSEIERVKVYNAITPYNMHTSVQYILDNFENNVAKKYSEWLSVAEELGVGFIPSALPGFDDTAVRMGNIPLSKSIDRFKKQMEIARAYMDKDLKMIMISTFNEWHEYTNVEPSIEDGYKYLQIIKEYSRL